MRQANAQELFDLFKDAREEEKQLKKELKKLKKKRLRPGELGLEYTISPLVADADPMPIYGANIFRPAPIVTPQFPVIKQKLPKGPIITSAPPTMPGTPKTPSTPSMPTISSINPSINPSVTTSIAPSIKSSVVASGVQSPVLTKNVPVPGMSTPISSQPSLSLASQVASSTKVNAFINLQQENAELKQQIADAQKNNLSDDELQKLYDRDHQFELNEVKQYNENLKEQFKQSALKSLTSKSPYAFMDKETGDFIPLGDKLIPAIQQIRDYYTNKGITLSKYDDAILYGGNNKNKRPKYDKTPFIGLMSQVDKKDLTNFTKDITDVLQQTGKFKPDPVKKVVPKALTPAQKKATKQASVQSPKSPTVAQLATQKLPAGAPKI